MKKRALKNLVIVTVFLILGFLMVFGGNVIVQNGQLNVTNDLYVDGNTLYVDNTNNSVGIGTTSPAELLTVRKDQNAGTKITLDNANTGTLQYSEIKIRSGSALNRELRLGSSYNYTNAEWNNAWVYALNRDLALKSTGDVDIYAGGNVSTEYIVASFNSDGSVGIGTTTPNAKLTVNYSGDTQTDYTAEFISSPITSGAGGILFSQNSYFAYKIYTTSSATSSGILYINYINKSSGEPLYNNILILREGKVGVNTTTPEYLLDVQGDIEVGTGTTGCVYDEDGTIIAGTCSSDIRLKKDIQPLTNVLENVAKLQPVKFKWKDNKISNNIEIGLIAQEVQKVLPELVEKDEEGYLRVGYDSRLTMYLIQSIKELKQENDKKEILINNLKQLICLDHPNAEVCISELQEKIPK